MQVVTHTHTHTLFAIVFFFAFTTNGPQASTPQSPSHGRRFSPALLRPLVGQVPIVQRWSPAEVLLRQPIAVRRAREPRLREVVAVVPEVGREAHGDQHRDQEALEAARGLQPLGRHQGPLRSRRQTSEATHTTVWWRRPAGQPACGRMGGRQASGGQADKRAEGGGRSAARGCGSGPMSCAATRRVRRSDGLRRPPASPWATTALRQARARPRTTVNPHSPRGTHFAEFRPDLVDFGPQIWLRPSRGWSTVVKFGSNLVEVAREVRPSSGSFRAKCGRIRGACSRRLELGPNSGPNLTDSGLMLVGIRRNLPETGKLWPVWSEFGRLRAMSGRLHSTSGQLWSTPSRVWPKSDQHRPAQCVRFRPSWPM